MLEAIFIELSKTYSDDLALIETLWVEIEKAYSRKKRHYHTLSHLENLFNQLSAHKPQLNDWDAVLFALFYHDAVYNVLKKDNEEKSAELAEKRMRELNVPLHVIEHCTRMILATKEHQFTSDSDTNFFTDADLSILGMDWEMYLEYCKQVRNEYGIFPDIIYNPGRRKALTHFMEMERIYKTDVFFDKYELAAKQNLSREISEVLK